MTEGHAADTSAAHAEGDETPTSPLMIALAWAIVVVPLLYGLWQTVIKSIQLLTG